MTSTRPRTEAIRRDILGNLGDHGGDIAGRVAKRFDISVQRYFFSHDTGSQEDWIGRHEFEQAGTTVSMTIKNRTLLKMVDVFAQYTSGEERDFSKTVVPVRLAQYGNDQLISRSQTRRVLAGLEKFATVVFDFEGVEAIGQGFSDEIFRVFQNSHPHIELMAINCVPDVQMFVDRVTRSRTQSETPRA